MRSGSMRSFLLAKSHGKAVDLVRSAAQLGHAAQERDARASGRVQATTSSTRSGTLRWPTRWPRAMAALPDEERSASNWPISAATRTERWPVLLEQPEGTVKSRNRNGLRRMKGSLSESGVRGS